MIRTGAPEMTLSAQTGMKARPQNEEAKHDIAGSAAMRERQLPEVPESGPYDVLVVGGGTTGVCAALAAARAGARTAIVDIYGFLGGFAVSKFTWLGFHDQRGRQVVKGLPHAIVARVKACGGATDVYRDPIWGSAVGVNPTWLKVVLGDLVREAGIEPWLHSLATAVRPAGPGRVGGVLVQNKEGTRLLRATVVVDCTDTADVAVLAGAKAVFGRRGDHRPQVASTIIDIGGVDMKVLLDWFAAHPDQIRPFPLPRATLRDLLARMRRGPVFGMGAFPDLVRQATAEGVDFPRDRLVGIAFPQWGEMKLVTTRVENVNPNDARNYSDAELEGLRQVKGVMDFVTRYMPGGRQARLIGSSHQIGLRETRHIEGDYQLTGADLMAGTAFPDVIALGAYHLDIHSPDHPGLETRQPPVYQVPYRCLLPRGLLNVLVAGRCIAADHEAAASVRVIPIAAAQGEAAGTAAAMAAAADGQVRGVPVADLQASLRGHGARLEIA